jgi:hypothetical protein
MRRTALLAAALWLLAAPAQAQETVVAGGGSFHDAPVLEPGAYRDTILPRETIYYAVELEAGQSFTVDADFRPPEGLGHLVMFGLNAFDPLRDPFDGELERFDDSERLVLETDRALTPELEVQDSSGAWIGPGKYFFTIVQPVDAERALETPVTFTLTIEGDASELPASEETETPTPTPTATPTPSATPAPEDDDGTPVLPALVGLVAGAALGFAGVTAARRSG